jgi:hypothetical protein
MAEKAVSRLQTLDQRLCRRRCLACGYDGALLRNGMAPRCARCGCDLRKRPARSYIEMEALPPRAVHRTRHEEPLHQPMLTHRWSFFLLLMLGALVMVMYLAARAFNV